MCLYFAGPVRSIRTRPLNGRRSSLPITRLPHRPVLACRRSEAITSRATINMASSLIRDPTGDRSRIVNTLTRCTSAKKNANHKNNISLCSLLCSVLSFFVCWFFGLFFSNIRSIIHSRPALSFMVAIYFD